MGTVATRCDGSETSATVAVPEFFGGTPSAAEERYNAVLRALREGLGAEDRALLFKVDTQVDARVNEGYDLGVARGVGRIKGENCGDMLPSQVLLEIRSTLDAISGILVDLEARL